MNIVTSGLETRTMKQEEMTVAGHWLCKHVSMEINSRDRCRWGNQTSPSLRLLWDSCPLGDKTPMLEAVA